MAKKQVAHRHSSPLLNNTDKKEKEPNNLKKTINYPPPLSLYSYLQDEFFGIQNVNVSIDEARRERVHNFLKIPLQLEKVRKRNKTFFMTS